MFRYSKRCARVRDQHSWIMTCLQRTGLPAKHQACMFHRFITSSKREVWWYTHVNVNGTWFVPCAKRNGNKRREHASAATEIKLGAVQRAHLRWNAQKTTPREKGGADHSALRGKLNSPVLAHQDPYQSSVTGVHCAYLLCIRTPLPNLMAPRRCPGRALSNLSPQHAILRWDEPESNKQVLIYAPPFLAHLANGPAPISVSIISAKAAALGGCGRGHTIYSNSERKGRDDTIHPAFRLDGLVCWREHVYIYREGNFNDGTKLRLWPFYDILIRTSPS